MTTLNRTTIIKLQSGLIGILICLLSFTIVLYRQNWFGKGDIFSFIFWSLPLVTGLAVSGKTFVDLLWMVHISLRFLVVILLTGLLSLGWAYCVAFVLGPWFGAYSIPIFYLWVISLFIQFLFLYWRLPKPIIKPTSPKILLGILSLPLTLIVAVIALYTFSYISAYLTKPEKETYLIPEGFKGRVFVIFNQSDGEKPEYENGRRIYRIPKTGVLFTQLKDEQGIINQEYYYISSSGKRAKLGVLDSRDFNEEWTTVKNPHEPPRDSLAIFNPGTMGTIGNSDDKNSKVFLELSVGTYNDIRTLGDFNWEYIDSLQNKRVF